MLYFSTMLLNFYETFKVFCDLNEHNKAFHNFNEYNNVLCNFYKI